MRARALFACSSLAALLAACDSMPAKEWALLPAGVLLAQDAGALKAPMGAAALAGSDVVIVTDDNPRGEDPAAIRAMVLEGAAGAREVADRREAIAAAVAEAGEGDIVLVAGKGHEQGQIVGRGENARVLPFDDVKVARECAGIPLGEK